MKMTSQQYKIMQNRIQIVTLSDGMYTFDIDGIPTSNKFNNRMDAVKWSVWTYNIAYQGQSKLKVVK